MWIPIIAALSVGTACAAEPAYPPGTIAFQAPGANSEQAPDDDQKGELERELERETEVLLEEFELQSVDETAAELLASYEDAEEAYFTEERARYSAYVKALETDPHAKYEEVERPSPSYWSRFDRLAKAGSTDALFWTLAHFHSELPVAQRPRDFVRRASSLISAPGDYAKDVCGVISKQQFGGATIDTQTAMSLLRVAEFSFQDEDASASAAYLRAGMMRSTAQAKFAQDQALLEIRRVAAQYPNTGSGKAARARLFELENLAIGMVAPDVVGTDVDGNAMKMSDFKGKVVVLDFWGFW